MYFKLNPLIIILSTIGSIWLLHTSNKPDTSLPIIQLTDSNAFQSIIECTDTLDGSNCFKQHKKDLIKQVKMRTPIGQSQWEACLDVLGGNNDINLLLNVQKCHHQAESLEKDIKSNTPFSVIGTLISLVIQSVLAVHFLLVQLVKNRTDNEVQETVKSVKQRLDFTSDKVEGLHIEVKEIKAGHNSDFKNVLGRLTKGGDIKSDIERVKFFFYRLNEELNQLKIDYYTKQGTEFMIIPGVQSGRTAGSTTGMSTTATASSTGEVSVPNSGTSTCLSGFIPRTEKRRKRFQPERVQDFIQQASVIPETTASFNSLDPEKSSEKSEKSSEKSEKSSEKSEKSSVSSEKFDPKETNTTPKEKFDPKEPKKTISTPPKGSNSPTPPPLPPFTSTVPIPFNLQHVPLNPSTTTIQLEKETGSPKSHPHHSPHPVTHQSPPRAPPSPSKISNNFDITTEEGRALLKAFMAERVRYKDLVKEENGKQFKRIMVPHRGWVAAKKLQDEEEKYGSNSFVQSRD